MSGFDPEVVNKFGRGRTARCVKRREPKASQRKPNYVNISEGEVTEDIASCFKPKEGDGRRQRMPTEDRNRQREATGSNVDTGSNGASGSRCATGGNNKQWGNSKQRVHAMMPRGATASKGKREDDGMHRRHGIQRGRRKQREASA